MKRITILALLLLAGHASQAQYSYEAVNDYGKLNRVTYDLETEDKLYAISQKNHLVVSYDNGQSWDVEYTFPSSLAAMRELTLLPDNEHLCFAITFATTNAQEQDGLYVLNIASSQLTAFIPFPEAAVSATISDFDVYDAGATTILLNLLTQSGNQVYYTTTAGENWDLVYNAADNADVSINTVNIYPGNPAKLILGRGFSPGEDSESGGLYISEDSGETWAASLAGEHITAVAFDPLDSNDILISSGYSSGQTEKLFRTSNAGASWTEVPMQWNDFITDNVVLIKYHPTIPGIIYILEENEIIYSNNDGASWIHTVYPYEEYYSGYWITLNPFYDKEAVISTNTYPQRTTDGGETLVQVKMPFCTIDRLNVVKAEGHDQLHYNAMAGHIHKNYATGASNAYNVDETGFASGRNQVIADPAKAGRVFTYDFSQMMGNGKLYLSNDNGNERVLINENFDYFPVFTAIASDPENDDIVYAVLHNYNDSRIIKFNLANPANVTFETIPTPGSINAEDSGRINGILFPTGSSDQMVITNKSSIFKSVNAGAAWTLLHQFTGLIEDVSANPFDAQEFAVATTSGVFVTTDGGEDWTAFLEGIEVRSVRYSDIQDGIMAAGIHDGPAGAYVMYYNGSDWVTVSGEELDYLAATAMDFSFSADKINAYVGTVDMGVVKYAFEIGELGLEDPLAPQDSISLVPNPSAGQVAVYGNFEVSKVSVYSLTGQQLLQRSASAIDVSSLANGIYIIKAENADGRSVTRKLVKN